MGHNAGAGLVDFLSTDCQGTSPLGRKGLGSGPLSGARASGNSAVFCCLQMAVVATNQHTGNRLGVFQFGFVS